MRVSQPQPVAPTTALERALLGLTLAVTAGLSLTLSASRIMWNDEFLSFYSDSVPTVRGVLDVQLHHPISLDPPTYHLLSHLAMNVFGPTAMALRLPAMAGFLIMQLALFALVCRVAGARAGVMAAALPVMTASFRYSAEGRPYGLLLGLYAAAFACWYIAATTQSQRERRVALVGVTVSMALAITSHYFGILIVLPLAIAELARMVERRRLDAGMTAAIVLGFLSVALVLPFQAALKPYRAHYYIAGVSIRAASQGYRELFVHYNEWPMGLQRAIALSLVLAVMGLMVQARRRFRERSAEEPASLWAGLAGLALLPVFGFLFGRFVTHTMEVRYVIAALLAFAVVIAMLLERRLVSRRFFLTLYVAVLLIAVAVWSHNIAAARRFSQQMLASLAAPPEVKAALGPQDRIYTQSLEHFFFNSYYQPDPDLRRRFTLVYDQEREIRWLAHDTNYVTAVNFQHFTALPAATYSAYLAAPHPMTVLYGTPWEWLKRDLKARQAVLTPLADSAFGRGHVYTVSTRR
jgi:4-amino-4-deoxy-L-arabinose transferase-like glycosyltransferase